MGPPPRRGRPAWRHTALTCAALALGAPAAHAAAYLPGAQADPPTGDVPPAASADEPLRSNNNGIQWRLAPWRFSGTLALDARWLRLEDGSTSRQGALLADIDAATYLWQPWFVQLRLGAGLVATRDSASDAGDSDRAAHGSSYTARAQVSVFPASRFPFEMRADITDSRVGGDSLGPDQRTHRFALSQSYRPENLNDQYQLHVDVSHLFGPEGRDSLVVIDGNALLQRGAHRFEFDANRADHHRGDGSDSALLTTLTARHGWHPNTRLDLDSMASWNRSRLKAFGLDDAEDLHSEVRQLSSLLTWRPRNGDLPFAVPGSTMIVGSARWVEQTSGGDFSARALSATLGASAELTPDWRAALSASANQFDAGSDASLRSLGLAGSLTWAPRPIPWGPQSPAGGWRWSPSAVLSAAVTRGSGPSSDRDSVGLQLSHSLSRDWLRPGQDMFSLTLSQTAAALAQDDAGERTDSTALAHSIAAVWQDASDAARQQFASISVSDSRSFGDESASFQLVNLQWSRRTQLSRLSSWSGNVTLQYTRSDASFDPASGGTSVDTGWQRFANGTLSYEQQRFWGIPRLRFTVLAGLSTQQLERRSAGDIDAPLERVSRSLEARWDYQIGRLDARLSMRAARVDERSVASIVARVQRRF
jgi:hypothetical protein